MNAALDGAGDVERLIVILSNPEFNLGTVSYKMAREYMESLKIFRTENSGTFEGMQWSILTQTLQGNNSKKAL